MEYIRVLFDFIFHIDVHLDAIVSSWGTVTYAVLFLIVFAETGLVVAPFLPGDSLLFAAGAIAARGDLNVIVLIILFLVAAILGDTVNYWIGRLAGEKLMTRYPRLIKPTYLARTNAFFERYGGKTIVIARFVPIVRTVAPFVAGAGSMTYRRFMYFNIAGAFIWVLLFVPAGFFFGNLPIVRDNFTIVILAIITLSFVPPVYEIVRDRFIRPKAEVPPVDNKKS